MTSAATASLHSLAGNLFQQPASSLGRVLRLVILAVLAHLAIRLVAWVTEWLVMASHQPSRHLWAAARKPKVVTILRLIANTLTGTAYFVVVGLILQESGVKLTAYLASASIVGLAVSFGSQGLVQDMVIGLTLIFSDAMDVDDMVEIAGTVVVVGRVEEIGLRFTKVVNLYGQIVFIPNRTIANVSRFPAGGVYAYADVQIPSGADPARVLAAVKAVVEGIRLQFEAIVFDAVILEGAPQPAAGESKYIRARFKIWPGQGALIETTFRQQALSVMRAFSPAYADWQVPVFYRAHHSESAGTASGR